MKAKKGQEKVESMAIKLFRFNYARDLMYPINIVHGVFLFSQVCH
jgi:hypothetical protein